MVVDDLQAFLEKYGLSLVVQQGQAGEAVRVASQTLMFLLEESALPS